MSLSEVYVDNCPNLTVRDALIQQISDDYKDINGIRPRWINFAELSDDELVALSEQVLEDHTRYMETEYDAEWENEMFDYLEQEYWDEMQDVSEWDEIDELYRKRGW